MVFQPSFTAIVFQCGGGLVSISIFLRAGFLFYISSTIRVSDVTLGSFWVPFRASSVFHCHGVLVWRMVVFSIGFSTTGKSWEKATFYRVSEGTLESFWCDFVVCPSFPAMVFWCGGGLLSAPDSLTGRGWDRFFF